MDIEKFREVLKERRRVCEETHDEWEYGVNQCFQEEIKILSKDIDSTIEFLKTECTEDEYGWISEEMDYVAKETQSRKFVDCLKELKNKYPKTWEEDYKNCIIYAEGELRD